MNSRYIEDENGLRWTATIKLGKGKAKYVKDGKNISDPTKPHLLEFTSDDKSVLTKPVGPEKASISKFFDEELTKLLKELQQSKP